MFKTTQLSTTTFGNKLLSFPHTLSNKHRTFLFCVCATSGAEPVAAVGIVPPVARRAGENSYGARVEAAGRHTGLGSKHPAGLSLVNLWVLSDL